MRRKLKVACEMIKLIGSGGKDSVGISQQRKA